MWHEWENELKFEADKSSTICHSQIWHSLITDYVSLFIDPWWQTKGLRKLSDRRLSNKFHSFSYYPLRIPPNIPLHLLVYPSLSVFTRLPLPYLCRQIAPTLLRRIQRCPLSLYTASNYRYFMKLANLFYFRKRRPRAHWLKPKGAKMYIQVHTEKESMEKNATLEKKAIL